MNTRVTRMPHVTTMRTDLPASVTRVSKEVAYSVTMWTNVHWMRQKAVTTAAIIPAVSTVRVLTSVNAKRDI